MIGYAGITPIFGVEFDTYKNYFDPPLDNDCDHISFIKNGILEYYLCNQYASLPKIEGAMDHNVRIIWDLSSEHMAVFFENYGSTPTLKMGVRLGNTFASGDTFWVFA